ncbi:MAG: PAS domain-containing protein [Myxococcales bacterium]|nr:PAS domain-containing protein [Myxococcales bacterium]
MPIADDALVDRIKWTTFARVLVLTAVLLFGIAMDLGMGPQPIAGMPETGLYKFATAFYFLSFFTLLATLLTRHRPRVLRALALASIVIDVAMASALVASTDGLESVFLFGFPLAVLNGAVLLERFGAVCSATLAAVVVVGLCAVDIGALPWSLLPWRVAWLRGLAPPTPPSTFEAGMQALVQVAAVYGTALLSSHLVHELARTRQRATQQRRELARLRVRYQDLVQNLPDGLLTTSPDGRVTGINFAGLHILQLSGGDVLAHPLTDLLPALAQAPLAGELQVARDSGVGGHTQELARERHGGPPQLLACRRVAFSDPAGPAGELVVFRDMTDARRREEEHRSRERLAAIGAMAAAVAHEIRNPLASISGAAQMLESDGASSDVERQLLRIVQRESARLSDWIDEFLDFARPRPLRPTPCDVRDMVAETLAAVQRDPRALEAGVQVRMAAGMRAALTDVAGAGRWRVVADVELLRQVAWNLLINALQAVVATDVRVVEIDLGGDDDTVVIAVDDSGAGIEPEELPHIFEPFWTTKGGGTGLGLATVERHVAAHRGEVHVERSALGGARFIVRLPRRAPTSAFAGGGVLPG